MDRGQALINALKSMLDQANATIANLAADLAVAQARIQELQAPKEPPTRKKKEPPPAA